MTIAEKCPVHSCSSTGPRSPWPNARGCERRPRADRCRRPPAPPRRSPLLRASPPTPRSRTMSARRTTATSGAAAERRGGGGDGGAGARGGGAAAALRLARATGADLHRAPRRPAAPRRRDLLPRAAAGTPATPTSRRPRCARRTRRSPSTRPRSSWSGRCRRSPPSSPATGSSPSSASSPTRRSSASSRTRPRSRRCSPSPSTDCARATRCAAWFAAACRSTPRPTRSRPDDLGRHRPDPRRLPRSGCASAARAARRPRSSQLLDPGRAVLARGLGDGDRDAPGALGVADQLGPAGQQLRVDRPGALVDEAAHGGFDEAFEQRSSRSPWIAARLSAAALGRAEQPEDDGRRRRPGRGASPAAPGRRGRARSPPLRSPTRPSSSRLVPRTSQPSSRSSAPSARPRQPQPTISARATPCRDGRRRGAAPRRRRDRGGCGRCGCRPARRTPSRSGPCGRHGRRGRSPAAGLCRPCSWSPQAQQRQHHRLQVTAFLGQHVLEALRVLAVAAALDDPFLDQRREALAEHVGGHSERVLELVEAAPAEEEVAQDQHRPALAEKGRAGWRSSSSSRRRP